MKFFFTAFGLHNKYIVTSPPEHGVFPLAKAVSQGMDLDYTALMIGNKFILDETAYELVCENKSGFLAPMAKTLQLLNQEELLDLVNFNEIISKYQSKIDIRLSKTLEDPISWFRVVQKQWRELGNFVNEFQNSYGTPENRQRNTVHFGVYNYLHKLGESDNERLQEHLNKLLISNRKQYTESDISHIREICKPLVSQILMNDLLTSQYGSPFLDWSDAQQYYEKVHELDWEYNIPESSVYKEAKIMFDEVIPDLKPNNIRKVIEFIREDNAVKSMRQDLICQLNEGVKIDKDFIIRYSSAALLKELALKKKMKRFRLAGSILTSFIPGGGLATEAAVLGAEEVIGDAVEGKEGASMEWFYALQKASVK